MCVRACMRVFIKYIYTPLKQQHKHLKDTKCEIGKYKNLSDLNAGQAVMSQIISKMVGLMGWQYLPKVVERTIRKTPKWSWAPKTH